LNIRIFSKKHNLYTNSQFWPSNQITTSDFLLSTSGEIVELINSPDGEFSEVHSPREFSVEPWTGYEDSAGKKIYLGDKIKSLSYNNIVSGSGGLDWEVVWENGSFWSKDKFGVLNPFELDYPSWAKHFVMANIHNVEFDS
jgi:hypothetical protein